MTIKQTEPSPGLPRTINFAIPAYWTPEQALAVFELLDDLRDQIGAHYSVQLFELSREQYLHPSTDPSNTTSTIPISLTLTPQSEKTKRAPSGPFCLLPPRRHLLYGSSPPATFLEAL